MQVTFEVPEQFAREFEQSAEELSRTALEAFALEGIRSGKLSEAQAQQLLGIESRYAMDGFLKEHGIYHSTTLEDVLRDTETAATFIKR